MVETIQVKLEEDTEGFNLPPPSSTRNHAASQHHETTTPSANNDSEAAAAAETDVLVALEDFLDRICLVKLKGKKDAEGNADTKLWPAVKFGSTREVCEKVKQVKKGLFFKLVGYFNRNKVCGSYPVAYLLGMKTMEESFIPLVSEDMAESFDEHINEILDKEEYKCNQKFQLALAIVEKRYTNELSDSPDEEDDDEGDDDSQSRDETVALDGGTLSSPSSNDQASVDVITIDDTPAKAGGNSNEKKRRGEDKNHGTARKKKKKKKVLAKQTPASKKKVAKQTPKSKSRAPPMVTPLQASSGDKDIAEYLDKAWSTPHGVMKHEDAWKLLEDKFGFTCVDGMFYPPPSQDEPVQDKPVASSLMGLRKDLCEKGLPGSSQPLSRDEKIDIARWVRYVHVNGLRDGQFINPNDQGKPIGKFMDGWGVLRDNFGCRYSNGKYHVPTSPNGGEIKVFETTSEVDGHFARFGVQCIPDNPGDKLSQQDRLGIELFFATPSFEVLNTL
jgi:hypothetical protein